jgi:hypothetical protein
VDVSGQLHALTTLPLGKEPRIGGWVGPRADLDARKGEKPLHMLGIESAVPELVTIQLMNVMVSILV